MNPESKFFETIPQPNANPNKKFDYNKLQDLIKEKNYLIRLQELLSDKNTEFNRLDKILFDLKIEIRKIKDRELEQKNKIINLIPSK